MARCSMCNRFGFFMKLTNGLCDRCETERIKRREEVLQNKQRQAMEELETIPLFHIDLNMEKRKRKTGFEPMAFSNITPKGTYSEFVVFDTETTGLTPSKDRIIELSAIRFVDKKPVERFETLVNPEKDIPEEVTSINKITNEMVASAPTISQVLPAFEEFVGKSNLVAHNLEFDLKFLFYSGSNIIETKRKYFDTIEQASKLLKKPKKKYDKEVGDYEIDYDSEYDVFDYKLETLCDYYDIIIPGKHRAAADALATGKLFCSLIDEKQSR